MQTGTIKPISSHSFWVFTLRFLIILGALLLSLLVALLPLSTSVPAWAWIVLALADITLVIFQFHCVPVWPHKAMGLVGMVLVGFIAVVASQVFAATPPITDASGEPIPGSIATLEKVTLNGSGQWITIRGQDVNNPILLNLGMGGPGGGGFATRTRAGAAP